MKSTTVILSLKQCIYLIPVLFSIHSHAAGITANELSPEDILKKDTIGVVYLTDDIPASHNNFWHSGYYADSPMYNLKLYRFRDNKDSTYTTFYPGSDRKYKGYKVIYNSFLNLSTAGNLPEQPALLFTGYHPEDFYRTSFSFGNDVRVAVPGMQKEYYLIDLGQNRYNATVPDAYTSQYKAAIQMKDLTIGSVFMDTGIRYVYEDGQYTGRGDGLAWLMAPVYTGTNEQEVNELMKRNKDDQKFEHLSAWVNSLYDWEDFRFKAWVNYDRQWDKWNRTLADRNNQPDAVYRYENTANLWTGGSMNYSTGYDWKKNFYVNYDFRSTSTRLSRNYETGTMPSFNEQLTRNTHDIRYGLELKNNNGIKVGIGNGHYVSNTLKGDILHHLTPGMTFEWWSRRWLRRLLNKNDVELGIEANLKRSISETPLIYQNQASLSTVFNSSDFNRYYYYTDIFADPDLKAESYLNSDLKINYRVGHLYHFKGEYSARVFYNSIKDFTAPVFESAGTSPSLGNIGRTHNYGYQLEAKWAYTYHHPDFFLNVQFSKYWNRVASLYTNTPFVRLAGFTDVASVFAKGDPVGAIYGSSYARNADGMVLRDASGAPVVDPELKKIGDSAPSFVMTFLPKLRYGKVTAAAVLEYSHGGDRWNGTQAFMDYAVDPSANRRIDEDYIQKATYFRLAELSVVYEMNRLFRRSDKSLKVGLLTRNLFVLTPYKGVDPSTSLFGNSYASGLDLFNQPSNRQYSINLTLEF